MSKKSRMNRGLDVLFSDNLTEPAAEEKLPEKAKNGAVSVLSVSLLEPNKKQPRTRFDLDALEELAQSIKLNGVLQPILVSPLDNGGYRIVAGERRWRAARMAGLREVPVFVRELNDKQIMQIALIENVQREDLSPIEEARAYQCLMDDFNMTQQDISDVIGKSRSAVANSMRLLSLSNQICEMIEDGKLTVGHAKMLAGLEDENYQNDCANMVVRNNMTVRELEEYIKATSKQKNKEFPTTVFMQENPFLREFEISVNDNSSIKAKAKQSKAGNTTVSLTISKDVDANDVLSKLAELLKNY